MDHLTGTMQVLVYTPADKINAQTAFYESLLGTPPYYSWYESTTDCGAKFRIGSSALVILCQDHPMALGPVALNIECNDVEAFYARTKKLMPEQVLTSPLIKPYGTHCFAIRDPLCNLINIYANGH